MQRSGSQKVLLVLSIITIIFAVLGLILSGLAIAGGALIGSVDPSEAADLVESTGIAQDDMATGVTLIGVLLLFACGIELLEGILGIRAANDNQKVMPLWVLALIGMIISLIGAVMQAIQGQLLSDSSMIGTLIGSALMFWLANNIKRQAGR